MRAPTLPTPRDTRITMAHLVALHNELIEAILHAPFVHSMLPHRGWRFQQDMADTAPASARAQHTMALGLVAIEDTERERIARALHTPPDVAADAPAPYGVDKLVLDVGGAHSTGTPHRIPSRDAIRLKLAKYTHHFGLERHVDDNVANMLHAAMEVRRRGTLRGHTHART